MLLSRTLIPLSLFAAMLLVAGSGRAADEKWVPLFNGKDLTGWKIHPKAASNFSEIITKEEGGKPVSYSAKIDGKEVLLWSVKDGLLVGQGPASHLFSERDDYENFRYKVVAKINDKGNSGQYFRTAFGPGFPAGYETQINATHKDTIRTGSLYPAGKLGKYKKEICVMDTAPHKADEFFTQEVLAEGDEITITVDGKVTLNKWKDPEHLYKKGHFALQGHDPGTVVTFKSIEVMELPATKK
jgi:hypothetical protein